MEPDVCLKCILGLTLCICLASSLDLECRSGEISKFPEATSEGCYDPTGFGSSDCVLFSCKQNDSVSWKTTDRRMGKIEFSFVALPERCGYTRYDFELEVYDTEEPFLESLACVASDGPWKTHSKRVLKNEYCPNCTSASSGCLKEYVIAFKYVYPGRYRIKATPYVEDGSTRQSQRSKNVLIDSGATDYVKKRLVDLNVNVSLQYRGSPNREVDVTFLFGPDFEFLKLDGSEVVMKLIAHVDPTTGDHACYATGREQACCAFQGGNGNSTSVECRVREKLGTPMCRASSGLVDCTFYNVTQGNYCVVVRFEDDRCTKGTVWSDQSHDPCRWDIRKEFNVEDADSDTVIDSSAEILYTAIALIILLGIVSTICIVRKRNMVRRRSPNDGAPRATQHYNLNNGHATRFDFGQLLTLTERPRPEVLLVYSRESPPFMELVASLRRVLDKICKCQIYDYFDAEMWNEVSKDPRGWVHALIVERKAKVVIVASEVAAIRQRSLMGEEPERSYKTPHPFDHLFLYALKLLRDGSDEDSYKNHFVVTFDGYTENSHLLEYFNPYARFVLPKHLNKLFEHLHGSDGTVHFDTSRRLEERYEVRQLRLQLEHLINMKLVQQSDVESQKLYDW